ncbi:MAG: ArsR/SmtB family transcription factor [Cyclobacteriaceae bacterium]
MKTETLDFEKLEKVADILRVIGHPLRIQVIDALRKSNELMVNELCSILDVDQSLLSQHLAKMKMKGVLSNRREGRNIFYSLKLKEVLKVMDCMRDCQIGSF